MSHSQWLSELLDGYVTADRHKNQHAGRMPSVPLHQPPIRLCTPPGNNRRCV